MLGIKQVIRILFKTKAFFVITLTALLLFSSVGAVYAATLPDNVDGSVNPLPGYASSGTAPDGLSVLVNIAIPLRNTDLLSSLAKEVSDPSSPMFGHYLSSQQIEEEFLPVTEYQSMLAYLQSANLPVLSTALDSVIVVSATAAQVKQYFGADVTMFTNGTYSYYMTTGASTINGAHFIASNVTALLAKPQLQTNSASSGVPNANITYTNGGLSANELPQVYNATALYDQGYMGENQVIGILDFFGSPTVNEDLQLFCDTYGYPSADLSVVPLAPNNPNLGAYFGWSTEVSLDVEMAHAMAPKADLELYITTGALSVATDIAQIVSLNHVSVLSMSLSFADEWQYSLYGGPWFFFNMLLPDQYFMLGSLQGITFLCSSGDAGGSGYSSGPAGNSCYPSDSPYVTSVGGTQTYLYMQPNGSQTAVQTAWSNRAYVPDNFNAGGGGGGVSFLEPKPWYQQKQQTPSSYPNGRMEPDLSLQAGIYPGIYIIDAGEPRITGGTSASAPLLAGFVALMAQSVGHSLGQINPFLYSLGNQHSLYSRVFTPITFGYTIPWTASFGYNLATGWGAPNIGEIAARYKTQTTQPTLTVNVQLVDSSGYSPYDVTPNQSIQVMAQITNGFQTVTSGSFTAKLVTLSGDALTTSMTYNSGTQMWTCMLTFGNQSGVAYVDVSGSSGSLSGEGVSDLFAGYIATFYYPSPLEPYTTAGNGLEVGLAITDLNGNPAPNGTVPTMNLNSYSIIGNQFTTVDSVALTPKNDSQYGAIYAVNLTDPYLAGPLAFMMQGSTYGLLPIMNGIYLQSTIMYPEVCAEPGALAPGQYLTIASSPQAPVNIASLFSYDTGVNLATDIATGSNVTAYLLDSSGNTVASANLVYANSKIQGALQVPANASSGLYTVMLAASYSTSTLGVTLRGLFYGQVWVSSAAITPKITLSPNPLFMGQTMQVTANICYPDGQEVTQGIYTVAIYPQQLQNQYASITYTELLNSQLTQLTYNPALSRWTANVTLPSPLNASVVSSIQGTSSSYAGAYEAYITGLSYDGYPTTTALSAQQGFFIQPYLYLSNQVFNPMQQTWGLALSGVTINGAADLSNNVFLDGNTVQSSTVSISDSMISGTLQVSGANVTLRGVHGGNLAATNSNITLINSDLSALTLVNSALSMSSSSYQTISPAVPTIAVSSPTSGGIYKGDLNVAFTVSGNSIAQVNVTLNGASIKTFSTNGTSTFTLQSGNYPDGNYKLQVMATQTDGISTTQEVSFNLNNQISSLSSSQSSLQNQLNSLQSSQNSLNSAQSTLQNQLNQLQDGLNQLNQTQSNLENQIGNLGNNMTDSLNSLQNKITDLQGSLSNAELIAFAGIGVAVMGIAIAVAVALTRRSKTIPSATP